MLDSVTDGDDDEDVNEEWDFWLRRMDEGRRGEGGGVVLGKRKVSQRDVDEYKWE